MASQQELQSRIKEFFRFSRQEISGLVAAVLITAFIFSFRDWGKESFEFLTGLTNLFIMLIIASLSFLFRLSCQKVYALGQGYRAEFKVWWTGGSYCTRACPKQGIGSFISQVGTQENRTQV